MGIIALHSNRIYKKDLNINTIQFIDSLIKEFNDIKVAAYVNQLKKSRIEALAEVNFWESYNEPDQSLYKDIEQQFSSSSVYLINSAINEAKAIQKSQDELRKQNIKLLEAKLDKINTKIKKTSSQKADLQLIKNNLKKGNLPFKKRARKYKLNKDNTVSVFTGSGKNKTETIYPNIYLFETQYLKTQQKRLKQRLGVLIMKQNKLKFKLNRLSSRTYKPQIVLGSKKLQKQARNSKAKRKLYKHQRAKYFIVSGRNDSRVGNYVFNYDYNNNRMIIKINKKECVVPNVNYPYGKNYIEDYYRNQLEYYKVKGSNRKPITYKITDYGKYYIVQCMLDIKSEVLISGKSNGVIGVDTNLGFWSVSDISSDGNLKSSKNICYDWNASKGKVTAAIRDAAKELVNIALQTGKPIVIEDLNIKSSSKTKSYNSSKVKNFKRNMFAYNKMTEALISRANKCGVAVYMVKPHYTSLIGKIKFMGHYKLSVHNLAALTIGRRYLNYNEKIPKKLEKKTWQAVSRMKIA